MVVTFEFPMQLVKSLPVFFLRQKSFNFYHQLLMRFRCGSQTSNWRFKLKARKKRAEFPLIGSKRKQRNNLANQTEDRNTGKKKNRLDRARTQNLSSGNRKKSALLTSRNRTSKSKAKEKKAVKSNLNRY
jgi:hypothetical protein